MKKADELSRICGQEIFVFIIDEDAKVTMFGSSERDFIPDYSLIGGENRKGPEYIREVFRKKPPVANAPGTQQPPPAKQSPSQEQQPPEKQQPPPEEQPPTEAKDTMPATESKSLLLNPSLYGWFWDMNKMCQTTIQAFPS